MHLCMQAGISPLPLRASLPTDLCSMPPALPSPTAAVQATLSFALNGIVFFFAGASAVNFMVR